MTRRKKFYDDFDFDDWIAPKKNIYVTGKISINQRGFGFVATDDGRKDIYVAATDVYHAMHGDTVKVRIISDYGERREGEVVEVVQHGNEIFICKIKNRGKLFWAEPADEKFNFQIKFKCDNKKYFMDLKHRHAKVVVKVTDWKNLRGEVLEVIDPTKDLGSDITEILRSHGVFEEFPAEVQAEAAKLETVPNANEISQRIDRRDFEIVTIDGEDAKDLDDGVFAKKIDGGYFLGVYIADVSYYVKPHTALDKEAFNRGTSIYPVDRVVPMLPVELSNGICSLNANVDRLVMACEMKINSEGKIIDYKIFPTTIHVYRRLSYTQVQKFIDGDTSELADCAENINTLLEIYKLRKKIRNERGSIDFDLPEIKIELDEFEKPVKLTKKINGVAENIIEECMLAANETVAEHTIRKNLPSLYRVHENPSSDKVEIFNKLLAHFSLHISANEKNLQPRDFQKIIEKIKNNPAEKVITTFALRTMQQARYSAENLGHFGIAAQFYTHFTSPIRRYPDLIVHRMLHASFETPEKISKLAKKLEEIAMKSSEMERRAVDIEREAVDLKSVEYMKNFLWRKFDGVICSVTNFGFFVELDNGVDGLVHASTLNDDYYNYIDSEFALIGQRSGKSFHIGDKVRVRLIGANVKLRQIDFELVDEVEDDDLVAEIN
ncbi:MAG: ribonuclease R [Selenomonadaceae bacterium]|nr:ribonuclease R [Selenomonadaceae bacterium]